jgi:hypothetical protein
MIYDLPTQDTFVLAWQASALSAAAFCRLHDLPYQRFLLWRRRLATSGGALDSVAFVELVPSAGSATSPVLAPAVTPDPTSSIGPVVAAPLLAPAQSATALVAELVLPGGLLLRFFQSIPNAALSAC